MNRGTGIYNDRQTDRQTEKKINRGKFQVCGCRCGHHLPTLMVGQSKAAITDINKALRRPTPNVA